MKLKMGEVPWSRTLQLARNECNFVQHHYHVKARFPIRTRMITRLERIVDITHSLSFSIEEIEVKLSESYRRHYSLKRQAGALRESWHLDLAALKAKECNGNQATIYKNLIQQERQKKSAKRMKGILGKTISGGLTKVLVERNGEIIELTDKEEIERACHSENDSKFTQTNDTPAMKGRLAEELGFLGTFVACDQLILYKQKYVNTQLICCKP